MMNILLLGRPLQLPIPKTIANVCITLGVGSEHKTYIIIVFPIGQNYLNLVWCHPELFPHKLFAVVLMEKQGVPIKLVADL